MKIELVAAAPEETRKDGPTPSLRAQSFPETQPASRRCSHTPCPSCGTRMVRSRDLRDMCLICGYMQSQA